MNSAQHKVVLKVLVKVAFITATGPLIYHLTGNDMIFMYYLSFNAAVNIVSVEYALKAYMAAEFMAAALDVLKDQTAPPAKKSLLKRIFRVG